MRAQTTLSSNRVFVYEVAGLRQNDETDQNTYAIRQSGSTLQPHERGDAAHYPSGWSHC
jgi:hypothetical protein